MLIQKNWELDPLNCPRPGLRVDPEKKFLSNTPGSSLQIDLVAPWLAWPQPSISASELLPQHHGVDFGLTHKVNFSYIPSPKSDFLSNIIGCFQWNST